ncbi:hypothetical protein Sjap_004363 [Stephania japonica]|uniref:Uncharacterized protein n=1 Tax=Stephania japonica TaxID=461633 RepID=A0AAP0PK76_9MAGN
MLASDLSIDARLFLSLLNQHSSVVKVKETTGIIDLDVVLNAREVLISLYTKTLHEIKAIHEDEGYIKVIKSSMRHRLKRLGCGQVEELIEEARDELTLIGKMIGAFN